MKPYDYETFLEKHESSAHQDALAFARETHLITFDPPCPCYHCGQPAAMAILYGFECIPRCAQCADSLLKIYARPPEKLYSVQETACILRIHPQVVSKKLKAGEITGKKSNGRWQIPQAEIDRLLHLRFELNHTEYIPLTEAAYRLNIHYQTLREWLTHGKIPVQRDPLSHGKQYFVALNKIEALLKYRTEGQCRPHA